MLCKGRGYTRDKRTTLQRVSERKREKNHPKLKKKNIKKGRKDNITKKRKEN